MSDLKAFGKIGWAEHFSNGGTGVTRQFDALPANEVYLNIARSVLEFNDSHIWMEKDNTELHSSLRDLSAFWSFHRKIHNL